MLYVDPQLKEKTMKIVLAVLFVAVATYVSCAFAIHFLSMPFEQITEVLNAANSSTNL